MNKYTKYNNKAYRVECWLLLEEALKKDIDISGIDDERYTYEQLKQLLRLREKGIEVTPIADVNMPSESMKKVADHLLKEGGFYEEHYEKVRRKWLINSTWFIVLLSFLIISGSIISINWKEIMKYFNPPVLELVAKTVDLEAGADFIPATYVKNYDETLNLIMPEEAEVNTRIPGSYYLTYLISNGKQQTQKNIVINVVDTTKPTIKLKSNNISVFDDEEVNAMEYVDEAFDAVYGDMKDKVTFKHEKTSDDKGKIIYTLIDNSNNVTENELAITYKKRPEPVVEQSITEKPIVEQQLIQNNTSNQETTTVPQEQTKEETNTQSQQQLIPQTITVTAKDKYLPIEENMTLDELLGICTAQGEKAIDERKANRYSCSAVKGDYGETIGYDLTFK